jgi:hypothetical protein
MKTNISTFQDFIKIGVKIGDIYSERLDNIRKILIVNGHEMQQEFRARQITKSPDEFVKKQINSPDRNKPDTPEKMQKAIDYAAEHSGNIKTTFGTPWFNRSGRAARGVFPYVKADDKVISLSLHHRMSYGAYLEFGYNRRFAVIEPMIRKYAPKVLKEIKAIMGGVK